MAKEPTPLGRRIKNLIDKGILIDDKTTIEIVKEYLKKPDFKLSFVAEGFPRNLSQAKMLKKLFDKVFYLTISQKETMKRLTSRRVCQQCQANFNLLTQPPKKKGVCDYCGAKLIQREDDEKKAIKKRLTTFHQLTKPVLDYYRQKGILEKINGERAIDIILKDILSRI